MTLEELKEKVRQLIGRARVMDAIEEISKWTQDNNRTQLKKEIALLKGKLTDLNREKRLGLLSNSEASIRQNNISYSVLGFFDSVDNNNKEEEEEKEKDKPDKLKILMLTANPANTAKLNLDKEHSTITQKLQKNGDDFTIVLKKAVSGTEFREFTQLERPDILHFSGHGEGGKYAGIVVQNEDKNGEDLIDLDGLDAMFEFLKIQFSIKVVLLNACYSEEQASIISKYVEYVIGTNVAIGDTAAGAFSSGFYFQLSTYERNNLNIENAFRSGRAAAVMSRAKKVNFVIYKNGELINL